jgi:putative acetyltransferase
MSSQDLEIRPIEDEVDLVKMRDLFRAYAAEFSDAIADTLSLQGFEDELADLPGKYAPPTGCLLLATIGDDAVGCGAYRKLGDSTCEMKRLYIAPEYRGRGVGRFLVEDLIRRATAAGYRRMVLDSVPEMSAALALYRSFGFVEIAPYYEHAIERTVYMEKVLD